MIIVAQSTYTSIEVGLHDSSRLTRTATLDKKDACAQLMPTLDALLQQEGITFSQVTHIIANQGPAPFSSLRTVITSMNGISYASGIPLIGVSVFEALNSAYNSEGTQELFIILKAYSKEYYYGFYAPGKEPVIGMCATDQLPPVSLTNHTLIVGHPDALTEDLQNTLSIIPTAYSSLESVAQVGIHRIHQRASMVHHLSPLYIKNHF